MNEDYFSKPGFGWTNSNPKPSVKFLNDQVVHENVGFGDFPGPFPVDLLQTYTDLTVDGDNISLTLKNALITYLETSGHAIDLNDFASSSLSNGRKLMWVIMDIPPHLAFHLHAHPNIELITVLEGRIHEYRLRGPVVTKNFPDSTGPDLKNKPDLVFDHRSTGPANFISGPPPEGTEPEGIIVNEVGSIHLTFTRDEGALLLVLWSGGHANVPDDQYPANASEMFIT